MIEAFASAARFAADVMRRPAVHAAWSSPSALDGYSVGGLAGHLYLATARLDSVLDETEPGGTLVSRREYYARPADGSFHEIVRDAAEKRGADRELPQRFGALVDRLIGRLDTEQPDRLVRVLLVDNGVTRLDDYVSTRIVELVVHGDDLAASAGLEVVPPADAVTATVHTLIDLARADHGDLEVLRAFARRERATRAVLPVL